MPPTIRKINKNKRIIFRHLSLRLFLLLISCSPNQNQHFKLGYQRVVSTQLQAHVDLLFFALHFYLVIDIILKEIWLNKRLIKAPFTPYVKTTFIYFLENFLSIWDFHLLLNSTNTAKPTKKA